LLPSSSGYFLFPSANLTLKIKIYKTIIFTVVLYGCETLHLTLREEHRLRVFENRVLTKLFELKRDKVTGGWRKLPNKELHYSYATAIKISNQEEWGGRSVLCSWGR
jgi:hypothetical protein